MFFNKRLDDDGRWLNGDKRYRLRFAAGQTPPVDAFWSLTLYDRAYVLFQNPLRRYGVNDRTDGLAYGGDGSLELQIQADEPPQGPAKMVTYLRNRPRDNHGRHAYSLGAFGLTSEGLAPLFAPYVERHRDCL